MLKIFFVSVSRNVWYTHPTNNQQNIRTLYYSFMCVYVVKRKKFCFCLFGYRSFFPGEQLRFIVRFSFCQKNIHIKDSIVVIKLIINPLLYTLQQCYCMMWFKKDQKILILCSWWCTPMIPIYLNYYYLLLLILRNIICNCKQTNKIVKFISNNTLV